jgi:hypothetical protein
MSMPTREKRLRLEQNKRRREEAMRQPSADSVATETSSPVPQKEPPMASLAVPPTHWMRFVIPDLKFTTYHGVNYDRGELLCLAGGPRDEQLTRMGFLEPARPSEAHLHAQCGVCGKWFLTEQFRDQHGEDRHADRWAEDHLAIGGGMDGPDGGAALRDVTGDAEERRMQQQYPLYLERTKATLESSPA